jgi:hypothetical protein
LRMADFHADMKGFDFHGENLTTDAHGCTRIFLCEERIKQRRRRGICVDLSGDGSKLRQERHIP